MDIRRKTCKHLVRLVLLIMMLLCVSKNEVKASGDVQQREYLHDIYNELKVLGWILKKPDQQITRDANK